MIRVPAPVLRRLRARAERAMAARAPDFVVGGTENPYLLRWHGLRRNAVGNVYLHDFRRDDDDRALHDHPWPSLSICLAGMMRETYAPRSIWVRPGDDPRDPALHRTRVVAAGDVVWRGPRFAHRLEVVARPALTLFLTGPRVREWGFWCPQGFRPWQQFVAPDDKGDIGRGCE